MFSIIFEPPNFFIRLHILVSGKRNLFSTGIGINGFPIFFFCLYNQIQCKRKQKMRSRRRRHSNRVSQYVSKISFTFFPFSYGNRRETIRKYLLCLNENLRIIFYTLFSSVSPFLKPTLRSHPLKEKKWRKFRWRRHFFFLFLPVISENIHSWWKSRFTFFYSLLFLPLLFFSPLKYFEDKKERVDIEVGNGFS